MAADARGPRTTEVVWHTLVGYGQVAAQRLPKGSNTDPFCLADTPWRYLELASSPSRQNAQGAGIPWHHGSGRWQDQHRQ